MYWFCNFCNSFCKKLNPIGWWNLQRTKIYLLVTYVVQQVVLFPLHIIYESNIEAVIEQCLIHLDPRYLWLFGYLIDHVTTIMAIKINSMFQMKFAFAYVRISFPASCFFLWSVSMDWGLNILLVLCPKAVLSISDSSNYVDMFLSHLPGMFLNHN